MEYCRSRTLRSVRKDKIYFFLVNIQPSFSLCFIDKLLLLPMFLSCRGKRLYFILFSMNLMVTWIDMLFNRSCNFISTDEKWCFKETYSFMFFIYLLYILKNKYMEYLIKVKIVYVKTFHFKKGRIAVKYINFLKNKTNKK